MNYQAETEEYEWTAEGQAKCDEEMAKYKMKKKIQLAAVLRQRKPLTDIVKENDYEWSVILTSLALLRRDLIAYLEA